MRDVAEKLRIRANEGEAISGLQSEAYKIARIKIATTSNTFTVRRVSLPPDQTWVMDLSSGAVSPVVETSNGFLVYKVVAKETLPMSKVREEIRGLLRSQRQEKEEQEIEESADPVLNDVFFRSQGAP